MPGRSPGLTRAIVLQWVGAGSLTLIAGIACWSLLTLIDLNRTVAALKAETLQAVREEFTSKIDSVTTDVTSKIDSVSKDVGGQIDKLSEDVAEVKTRVVVLTAKVDTTDGMQDKRDGGQDLRIERIERSLMYPGKP
jgi:phage I-like protein